MPIFRTIGLILAATATATVAAPLLPGYAIYHVTSSNDSGPNSLRQAILDGNQLTAAGDIVEIYIDLDSDDRIELASSLPELGTSKILIQGNAATRAVIDGQQAYPILHAKQSVDQLIIRHLELRQGGGTNAGACLYSESEGPIRVDDVAFVDCLATDAAGAADGGAIAMNSGKLTVLESQFFNNVAEGKYAHGGAIQLGGMGTELTVKNSAFHGNESRASHGSGGASIGGAIRVRYNKLVIQDSIFRNNVATVTQGATTTGASNSSGAVDVSYSSATLERNLFVNNFTSGSGGAVRLSEGLDGDATAGHALINNSFIGNQANGSVGGAIVQGSADLILRNNSFFLNSAKTLGDSLRVATPINAPSANAQLWNNLFADGAGSWCNFSNTSVSSGHNVVPDSSCIGNAAGNIISTDLALQDYLDHQDYLPVPQSEQPRREPLAFFIDSPALDAGYPGPPDDDTVQACPELDGFGHSRVVDGNASGTAICDIGAFEWPHEAPLFADDFEDRIQPLP